MGRGRPRINKDQKSVDEFVTPKHRHQVDLIKKDEEERSKQRSVKEEFYTTRKGKLIKITTLDNGNSYSSFVGMERKCLDLISNLKTKGLYKAT